MCSIKVTTGTCQTRTLKSSDAGAFTLQVTATPSRVTRSTCTMSRRMDGSLYVPCFCFGRATAAVSLEREANQLPVDRERRCQRVALRTSSILCHLARIVSDPTSPCRIASSVTDLASKQRRQPRQRQKLPLLLFRWPRRRIDTPRNTPCFDTFTPSSGSTPSANALAGARPSGVLTYKDRHPPQSFSIRFGGAPIPTARTDKRLLNRLLLRPCFPPA